MTWHDITLHYIHIRIYHRERESCFSHEREAANSQPANGLHLCAAAALPFEKLCSRKRPLATYLQSWTQMNSQFRSNWLIYVDVNCRIMFSARECVAHVYLYIYIYIYIYIYHISQFKPKLSLGSFKLGNDDKSSWHHIGSWNLVDCSLGSVDLISFSQPPLKLRKPCKATRINQKEYIKKIPLIAHMFLTLKWQNPCKPQNEQSAKYANLILLLACCLQLPKSNQWHQCQKNQ